MKKIHLSKNLKDEVQYLVKSRGDLAVLTLASVYDEAKWMFLNSTKKSFTTVISEKIIGFVVIESNHNMCMTSIDNRIKIDIGSDEVYISEVKKDVPNHVEMLITLSPLDDRKYDEVFSHPQENQKELERD